MSESKKEFKTYFGKRFYKEKKGYWVNSMPIHAQRWVWINHHGAIPDGMDIHHIDGNKNNNEIENLEMLTRSEHLKKHWKEGTFSIAQRRAQLDEARIWLSTPQGKKRQAEDAKEGWKKKKLNPYKKLCLGCNNEYETYQKWAKCCSEKCYRKYRRANKIGFVWKKCYICGKEFYSEKTCRIKTCGKDCGVKLQAISRLNQ